MSLMARCLERANIDEEHKEFATDHHQDSRELFFDGNPDNENFATELNAALKALQKDVFKNTQIVLTIFSNFTDKTLTKFFQLDWIIGDEIGATPEPELILPIVYNI
ncbi:hypothetical protein MMC22_001766 [Lobaria immixta]|nr:hypothetical protein [Lobaria immixta]